MIAQDQNNCCTDIVESDAVCPACGKPARKYSCGGVSGIRCHTSGCERAENNLRLGDFIACLRKTAREEMSNVN